MTSDATAGGRTGAARRRAAAAAPPLLAAAAVIALLAPKLDAVFGTGFEGTNAGAYYGLALRNWRDFGFAAAGGRVLLDVLPTSPPEGEPYANHPPLTYYAAHVAARFLGVTESSVRLVFLLCCAGAAAVLARFAAARAGLAGGLLCAATFAALPVVGAYGAMPSFESPSLLLAAAASALLLKPDRGRAATLGVAGLAFLAALTAWEAWLLVLAAWAAEGAARRRAPSKSATVAVFCGIAAGWLCFFAALSCWFGGASEAFAVLRRGAGSAGGLAERFPGTDAAAFAAAQAKHLAAGFGAPAAVFGLFAAVRAAVRLARPLRCDDALDAARRACDAYVLTATAAACAYVAAFPGRSFNHDFWWFALAGPIAVAVGAGAFDFRGGAVRKGAVAGVVAAVLGAAIATPRARAGDDDPFPRALAGDVDRHFGEGTLLLMPVFVGGGPWFYYARTRVLGGVDDAAFEALVARFRRGDFGGLKLARVELDLPGRERRLKDLGFSVVRERVMGADCVFGRLAR